MFYFGDYQKLSDFDGDDRGWGMYPYDPLKILLDFEIPYLLLCTFDMSVQLAIERTASNVLVFFNNGAALGNSKSRN